MLLRHRFLILSVLLLVVMALHTRNGQWVADFWEHSAVVRELATHPLHPTHPILLLDAPHPFYSPYALATGFLARTLGGDAVQALAIMGMVNLTLLLVGLRLFIDALGVRRPGETAFYALLLTLFWWGTSAWMFSGFFHIGVLRYVLPYPSTFAASVSLIAIWMNDRRFATGRQTWLLPIGLIAVTVFITHPFSFVFLGAGLASQAFSQRRALAAHLGLVATVLGGAVVLAALWPYFPVLDLFGGQSTVYNESNSDMYGQVFASIWPSLAAVPFVVDNVRTGWRRPLVLMPALLVGIYVCGGLLGIYALGRVISYVVLLLHITLAERLAGWETELTKNAETAETAESVRNSPSLASAVNMRALAVPAAVIAVAAVLSWRPLGSTLKYSLLTQTPASAPYEFLSECMGQYELVLADIDTSWMVPTFGGKIVGTDIKPTFLSDQPARQADVERFFGNVADTGEREAILRKYLPKYLLLRKDDGRDWLEWQRSFVPRGRVVCENESLFLTTTGMD